MTFSGWKLFSFGFCGDGNDQKFNSEFEPHDMDSARSSNDGSLKPSHLLSDSDMDTTLSFDCECSVGLTSLIVLSDQNLLVHMKTGLDRVSSGVGAAAIDLAGIHLIKNGSYMVRMSDEEEKDVDHTDNWQRVYCGETHTILVNEKKMAYQYRSGIPISLKICVKEVSCGKEHVVMLSESGGVFTMGNGSRGQLGHGDLENQSLARRVEGLEGVACIRVVAGGWHSCVLTDCGDLFMWGWNQSGQLGIVETNETETQANGDERHTENAERSVELHGAARPQWQTRVVGSESEAIGDTVGAENTSSGEEPKDAVLVLTAPEEEILEEKGETEMAPVNILAEPTLLEIVGGMPVVDVACGSRHTIALTADHRVYVWGWNKYGQLGLRNPEIVYSPRVNTWFSEHGYVVKRVFAGYWTSLVTVLSCD